MHRIDHPTADTTTVPGKSLYSEGNPALGTPATVVTDDWLNDLQENVMAVLAAASVTAVKGRTDDLLDAIRVIGAGGLRAGDYITYNSTPQTLTNGVLGDTVAWIGTGAATFTLPIINTPAGNCPKGTRIELVNYGTGALTINRQSADTFITNSNASPVTTIATLPVGGNVTLESNGTGTWLLVGGTLALQYGDHLGKTAAQFDNSQLLATTAFVQRASGNKRGYTGITTNTTLDASHAGNAIYASSTTGAITLSLPAASALVGGSTYRIFNTGVDDVIVTRVGGDTIVLGTTSNTVTAVTLGAGDWIELTSLGTGSLWYHSGGTSQLVRSTLFGSNIGTNGWQRLPSGLIIQWGTVTGSVTAGSGSALTVTLPITFPTGGLAAYGNHKNNTIVNGGYIVNCQFISTSQLTVVLDDVGSGPGGTQSAFWMAIGN